eukprot:110787-Rhodomonas_salina.1
MDIGGRKGFLESLSKKLTDKVIVLEWMDQEVYAACPPKINTQMVDLLRRSAPFLHTRSSLSSSSSARTFPGRGFFCGAHASFSELGGAAIRETRAQKVCASSWTRTCAPSTHSLPPILATLFARSNVLPHNALAARCWPLSVSSSSSVYLFSSFFLFFLRCAAERTSRSSFLGAGCPRTPSRTRSSPRSRPAVERHATARTGQKKGNANASLAASRMRALDSGAAGAGWRAREHSGCKDAVSSARLSDQLPLECCQLLP